MATTETTGRRILARKRVLILTTTFGSIAIVLAIMAGIILRWPSESEEEGPPPSGMRQHAVQLDKFSGLAARMTKTAVDALLGNSGEHQFTYVDSQGVTWQCVEYSVGENPRYASAGFDVLYRDGAVFALINYLDAWNHYRALTETQARKSNDLERDPALVSRLQHPAYNDDLRIQQLFRVKSLRGEEIRDRMPQLKARILADEREHSARTEGNQNSGLTRALNVLDLLGSSRNQMRQAYRWNAQMRQQFDGNRVTVGMTVANVEQMFGNPLRKQDLGNGTFAAIYGPADTTNLALIQPYLACTPVLVLYRQAAAIGVVSNSFFSPDWRDAVWPALKSPQNGSIPE